MVQTDRQTLVGSTALMTDMGFSEAKVSKALKETRNQGLQPAMDWLFEHQDDADEDIVVEDTSTNHPASGTGLNAGYTLKCEDCKIGLFVLSNNISLTIFYRDLRMLKVMPNLPDMLILLKM